MTNMIHTLAATLFSRSRSGRRDWRPLLRTLSGGLLLAGVAAGCVTQRVSPSGSSTQGAATTQRPITTEVVRMASGPAALEGFEPLVSRITEGGECTTSELAADGVRSISMAFPTLDDPRTRVTLVVDGAGTVLRYSEERGGLGPRTGGGGPDIPGASDGPPRTAIEMNFQTGQARALNTGGGRVGFGVQGRTAEFQYHPNLAQPLALANEVRDRCLGRG